MSLRRLLSLLALMIGAASTVQVMTRYQRWKKAIRDSLQANSRLCITTRGPVEYSIKESKRGLASPIVLLAHGTPGGYDQSAAIAHLFNDDISCISVSRPGYLRTPLSGNETPEAQAHLFVALLDRLGIEHVTMLGVSGGGPCAIEFAARYPQRCHRLVLLCAVSHQFSEREEYAALPLWQRLIRLVINGLIYLNPSSLPIFLVEGLGRRSHISVPDSFLRTLAFYSLRKRGDKNDMYQFEHIQGYPLERITVPTLIMQGDADNNLSVEHAYYAANRIPNAQLVIDKGGDHFFFFTHKEQVLPVIEQFVER